MKISDLATKIAVLDVIGDAEFNAVSTDTRNVSPGNLFVALKGDTFDGHGFLALAADKGAAGVVVEQVNTELSIPQIVVNNTTLALGEMAAVYRDTTPAVVISLTGSCGKTSVKGMLQSICDYAGNTLATIGNLNNHIGVPLTLMRLTGNEKYVIVEAGTSGLGEIGYLANIVKPDIALVNNVFPAHLEGLKSEGLIANEKADLYRGLSETGKAIINLDDKYASYFLDVNAEKYCIGYSLHGACEQLIARCNEVVCGSIDNQRLSISVMGKAESNDSGGTKENQFNQNYSVTCNVVGSANYANVLAACVCAYAAGISFEQIVQGLKNFAGVPGRMQQVENSYAASLIDDTYNANPGSVCAALEYLAAQKNSVFIFGGMGELGDFAEAEHAKVGFKASQLNIRKLFCVGPATKPVVENFGGESRWFETQQELLEALTHEHLQSAAILVKGSRATKMENVVKAIVEIGVKRNASLAG